MMLGYTPMDFESSPYDRDPSIIEAKYSVYEEQEQKPQESMESRIIALAEEAELNQLTLKDLIKAGIDLDEAKSSLQRLVQEGVCEEVSLNGVKHYCF